MAKNESPNICLAGFGKQERQRIVGALKKKNLPVTDVTRNISDLKAFLERGNKLNLLVIKYSLE